MTDASCGSELPGSVVAKMTLSTDNKNTIIRNHQWSCSTFYGYDRKNIFWTKLLKNSIGGGSTIRGRECSQTAWENAFVKKW